VADIINANCLDHMATMPESSIAAIVTDPPYGLGFMGREWDHGVPGEAFWREALRVAKPGAHIVAFGGTRTYHRLAVAIEDAGWEIRDCLGWLYGSGFPKSLNIGNGYGTALKPAWEPIILARKPLGMTVAACVLEHGTGALNIDGCRVEFAGAADEGEAKGKNQHTSYANPGSNRDSYSGSMPPRTDYNAPGRWPANIAHDGSDEVLAVFPQSSGKGHVPAARGVGGLSTSGHAGQSDVDERNLEAGSTARFFYCAKASRSERETGLEAFEPRRESDRQTPDGVGGENPRNRTNVAHKNHHPTVKPIALMRWLVRLVTPPGGTVLDPFMGSGTTLVAAQMEGFDAVGIDLEAAYCDIARARLPKQGVLL
jgi:DNA modification methylase